MLPPCYVQARSRTPSALRLRRGDVPNVAAMLGWAGIVYPSDEAHLHLADMICLIELLSIGLLTPLELREARLRAGESGDRILFIFTNTEVELLSGAGFIEIKQHIN
jgi:hypothetical protein